MSSRLGKTSYSLGINAYDHDVAACLLADGEIVAAIAKERLTRVKHDQGFFQEVVDYCLAEAGISPARPDRVVANSYLLPLPELEQRLLVSHRPYHLDQRERKRAERHPYFRTTSPRYSICSHHLAHAYSAFAVSPFEEGAVMVVDGVGSHRGDVTEKVPKGCEAHPAAREAESYYRFSGTEIETVEKVFMGPVRGLLSEEFTYLPGIGALYSRVSDYVFGNWNRCGEVMGLAPYGNLDLAPLLSVNEETGDVEFLPWPDALRHPFPGGSDKEWTESLSRGEWQDLCRRVQEDTERALVARARRLHEKTGTENLVLAGGVALNCVANGRLLEETPFKRIFVQPAAGDDGVAMGCALYGHLALEGGRRGPPLTSVSLGRRYREAEIDAALKRLPVRLACSIRKTDNVAEETAALLAAGKVVGWFQGGSEFGPRALGHRSILADPRQAAMKDRVNERVKHRQSFRPFAPAVLVEKVGEWFAGGHESPFMLLVAPVVAEMRDRIPAVTHVDGTARVQTVRREDNPRYYDLIAAFERRTGVPVILNTSLNDRGEPIVETPEDAISCLLGTGLDALVIEDRILVKRGGFGAVEPLIRLWQRTRRNMRSGRIRSKLAEQLLDHE